MSRLLAVTVLALVLCPLAAQAQLPPDRPPGKGVGKKKQPAAKAEPTLSDAEALKKADLAPTDGPKLLGYLKQRTLSDSDQARIAEIIARFGADDFDDRVKATEEIEAFGPAAVGPLKKEADKPPEATDPEVRFRAKLALKKLETVPHSAVAAAVVRAVVKLKPEGAAGVLIGFLPLADSEAVADAIREALVELAERDGKAEPALLGALTDASPVRRAAAYVALTEGGPKDQLIHLKDAYPELRTAVLRETDLEAKFTGLWALALVTREKEFVPALIELIPQLPRGRIWQLEELLLSLAGAHPKDGRFLKSAESLAKARDAWLGWWKEKGEKIDLVKFDYHPEVQGYTDVIEMDSRGYAQGRVISIGPDLKEKWRIGGLNNPTDVKIAPSGHVWVVESNNSRLTEWVPGGTSAVSTRSVGTQPLTLDFLPDGGMVVVGRNQVVEWDKNGNQKWAYQRPSYDILSGRRLPSGETVFVTQVARQPNQKEPPPNCFRLDAKGKEIKDDPKKTDEPKKALSFGYVYQMQSIGLVGEERILVCERDMSTPGRYVDRVAEYDLKTGKLEWKHDCPQNSAPTSCQRLRNGNTLICLMNLNQLIEVDPSGEIVWEYQAKDGLRVGRGYRR